MLKGEVCVTMSVVDEFAMVEVALSRLHAVYPHADRVLIVDNDDAEVVARWQLQADSTTQVRKAVGIYRTERGGSVVDLHLQAFMRTAADWWFKIDPDTFVRRPLNSETDPGAFSGTLQAGIPRASLQGGCIVGGREAVARILSAGVLRSSELLNYERTWAAGNGVLLRRARERGLVSFDFIHAWACERIGVRLHDHPEINSRWLRPPPDGERYAVTHPHKECSADETGTPVTDLDALLSAILPDQCSFALVRGNLPMPPHGTLSRAIVVDWCRRPSLGLGSDGDQAARHVLGARAAGARFVVVAADARTSFGRYPELAEYLLDNFEVVFWQDDLALIFDLSRASLRGPHLEWYRYARQSGSS